MGKFLLSNHCNPGIKVAFYHKQLLKTKCPKADL